MNKFLLATAFLFTIQLGFSQVQVKGRVLDESGEPIPGVVILELPQATPHVSDVDGAFAILTSRDTLMLEFRLLSYETVQREVISAKSDYIEVILQPHNHLIDEVLVVGVRAQEDTPMSYSNISAEELASRNLGQDIPIMLNYLPSVVTTSDAGAGVGYTGMRVRGSDASRVNVTINGIPFNDSESQGTFWVNLPDFSSSVENAQLQRGVGTSTNGSGAFGASLNLLTTGRDTQPGVTIDNSFGSFNTRKHSLALRSGLLSERFTLSARLSKIASDGYIDRATSDLNSYFLQGAYTKGNTVIKALMFGGREETYQAWYGIDSTTLADDRTTNFSGIYTDSNGVTRYYDNEVDNYSQDHYQLHLHQQLNEHHYFNLSGHYTYGRGYFEQYKEDEDMAEYDITPFLMDNILISSTDVIRRRWLDNDFYGATASYVYDKGATNVVAGGGYHIYKGDHFGEIIWAQYAVDTEIRDRYYDTYGDKDEAHAYVRLDQRFLKNWGAFVDVQLRSLTYRALLRYGKEVDESYAFFNPKVGLSYALENGLFYASYARANKEPNRTDFESGDPKPEVLDDFELGLRSRFDKVTINANLYFMLYQDQLVLTGAVDDVGSPIRSNIGESTRTGFELDLHWQLSDKFYWRPNFTLSSNKNIDYVNETASGGVESLGDTRIAFSPEVIIGNVLSYSPLKDINISLLTKYVGEQYMSNIEAPSSILDAYLVNDLSLSYTLSPANALKQVRFNLLVNNILDEEYVSNGYWGPGYAGYFPQAGINFLAGISADF